MKAILLTLLMVFAGIENAHAGFTLPAADAPSRMGVQFKSGDETTRGLEEATAGGFKMIRMGVYWYGVEKTKGVYSFTSNDAFLQPLIAQGVPVNITLYGNNSLYGETGLGIHTAAGRQGFANFAAAVAAHYKGAKFSYEIYNEPNTRTFWGGSVGNTAATADEYYALVALVAPAIKKADPDAYVAAGSISCMWSASWVWVKEIIKDGILKTGINAISVHPYGFAYPEQTLTGTYNFASLRSMMDAAGGSAINIVTSEVGYTSSSLANNLGVTSAQEEDAQGWLLVRQQLVDLIAGNGYSIWYQLRDSDGNFGVMTTSYAAYPAYHAAQTYEDQLSGYTYAGRLAQADASDYVVLFKNASGAQKLVAWTSAKAATHSISVAVTTSAASLATADTYGTAGKVAVASDKISLKLTGAPQYVSIPAEVGVNLALKKTVTTSSGQSTANALVDGNTASGNRWFSASSYPQTIEIDLGASHSISQVNYFQYAARTKDYTVQVYNGSSWVTVATVTGATSGSLSSKFTAVKGSKVRFTINKGTFYQKGYELQVIGQ